MIVLKQITNKAGKQQITIVLEHGETLHTFRDGGHYQLGYPVEDVVGAHIITEARRVTWCSASQAWVE